MVILGHFHRSASDIHQIHHKKYVLSDSMRDTRYCAILKKRYLYNVIMEDSLVLSGEQQVRKRLACRWQEYASVKSTRR